MAISFIWRELENSRFPGVYVEDDSLEDYDNEVPTAHWSTVEEAQDMVGYEGVTFSGGPLDGQ